jgi:hypothetical protein
MARRKSSAFDDLLDVALIMPWWLSVALALTSFVVLHLLASEKPDPHAVKNVADLGQHIKASYIQVFANFLQYVIPPALLLGAIVGIGKKMAAGRGRPTFTIAHHEGNNCPECGASMIKRKARRGANAGGDFWGCSTYPKCKGTRPWDVDQRSNSATRPTAR